MPSTAAASREILCADFGSTFTKAVLLAADGTLIAKGATPTTLDTDVMDGFDALAAELGAPADVEVRACSSAGGGLRLAVVGYERTVTAEAGHRVGLSAGAKVVHVAAGELTTRDISELKEAKPDIILLVGGTDGGNSEVLAHNANRLASARINVPLVVAGNTAAQPAVIAALERTGRRFVVTDNVMPRIGEVNPLPARAAIRQAFLTHVIGGKGLSQDARFTEAVRAATPDVMLLGIDQLAHVVQGDILVVDIGGATTDVYSVVHPDPGDETPVQRQVVESMQQLRTVEGDLGLRWNAVAVLEAAHKEDLLPQGDPVIKHAGKVQSRPAYLPVDDRERELDLDLARYAATVAVRRHARPLLPGEPPRALIRLGHVIGSGGILRAGGAHAREVILGAVATDHAGGWRVPRDPVLAVDEDYLLFAAGLLAEDRPQVAQRAAAQVLVHRST